MAVLYNGALLVLIISTGVVQAARPTPVEYVVRQTGTIDLSPNLSFDTIGNLTTCEFATIRWFYAGPPGQMTLSVTNIDVPQVSLPPAPSITSTSATSTPSPIENSRNRRAPGPFVDMVISNQVDPSSLSYRWTAVNVASGSYKLEASMEAENFLQESFVFHVLTGRNTACIQSSSTSATNSASTNSATGTTSEPAQTSGSWVPGGSGGQSKNPINVGSIVGIVLGVLAMTILGVGAYFMVRNRRRRELIGGGGGGKKWNHLNSTDSRGGLIAAAIAAPPTRGPRRLSTSHRRGSHSNGSSTLGHTTKNSQDDIAEKEVGSPGYPSRKNSVASYDSNAMALSTLPSLHHHNSPNLGYDQDDTPSPQRRKASHLDPTGSGVAVRRSSSDAKARSRSYLPTIESANNSGAGTPEGTSFSHNSYEMHSPSAPSPLNLDGRRENRQSFHRKRKPVPAYHPESESPTLPGTPSPIPPSPSSATPLGTQSHQSHEALYSYQSQPHSPNPGGSMGHYSTRNGGNESSRPATSDGSELLHKSSLGLDGKPVHYLMPDLPPDQRR